VVRITERAAIRAHSPRTASTLINGIQPSGSGREIIMTKIRSALIGAAVLGTALLATSSAGFAAGTSKQRSACMGDAFRLCSAAIPNVSRVTACMKSNYSKLTPGCKATFKG
jgi:hypothetical protein